MTGHTHDTERSLINTNCTLQDSMIQKINGQIGDVLYAIPILWLTVKTPVHHRLTDYYTIQNEGRWNNAVLLFFHTKGNSNQL